MFNVQVSNLTTNATLMLRIRSMNALRCIAHKSAKFRITNPSWGNWAIQGDAFTPPHVTMTTGDTSSFDRLVLPGNVFDTLDAIIH